LHVRPLNVLTRGCQALNFVKRDFESPSDPDRSEPTCRNEYIQRSSSRDAKVLGCLAFGQ